MSAKKVNSTTKPYMAISRPSGKTEGAFATELCLLVKSVLGDRISKNGKPYTLVSLASAQDKPGIVAAVYGDGEKIRDAAGKFIECKADRDEVTGASFPSARTFISVQKLENGAEQERRFTHVYRFHIVGEPA